MKNQLFIMALILSIISSPAIGADMMTAEDLENLQVQFYESPLQMIPDVKVKNNESDTPGISGAVQNKKLNVMPLFKKCRIRLTNFYREKEYKRTQKLLEKQKAQELEEEITVEPIKTEIEQPIVGLEGGIKEQVVSKEVQLDADKIDFDETTMDMIATGSPVLYFPPQDTTIKADKMIYNNASNKLKLFGNVQVIKNDNVIKGDYMQINMNEENAFMDNIKLDGSIMTVTSRKGEMDGDKAILYNGKMVSTNSYILNLQTEMVGGDRFSTMLIDDDDKSSITDTVGDTVINVKAKDIIVNAKKDHDTFTIKKAKVNYGDVKLFTIPSLTIHTNKNHNFFEANYPELGSRGLLGSFVGPGFVFDTPLQRGSTVKLIPFLNNKDKFGVGAFVKYRSATNVTDFGYGSSQDIFILKGRQHLDDKLYLQYGINSYMDEWFLGPRMAKYDAEFVYSDQTVIPSTIGKDLNLNFRHRVGLGYMHDGEHNNNGEHIAATNVGTLRTRYMAEASQTLFSYKDLENRKILNLSLLMQGSAALYGTGDTQFIGRIGPALHTQYKYWMQDVGFLASAYQDGTPMKIYDTYRYGHGSVFLREALRLNKYIALAWSGNFNVTGDSPNGEILQENSFIIALGPDDFKINLGYDWCRKQTFFSFVIAMDTKGSSLEYDKMVIKNPDRLSKSNNASDPVLKVFDNTEGNNVKPQPKQMKYAEVIEIEDPDKEQI